MGQCNLYTLLQGACLLGNYLALLNCPYHQLSSFRARAPQLQTSNLQFLTHCCSWTKGQRKAGSDLACSAIANQSLPLKPRLPWHFRDRGAVQAGKGSTDPGPACRAVGTRCIPGLYAVLSHPTENSVTALCFKSRGYVNKQQWPMQKLSRGFWRWGRRAEFRNSRRTKTLGLSHAGRQRTWFRTSRYATDTWALYFGPSLR